MKTLEIDKATAPLAKYVDRLLQDKVLIITDAKVPVAAIVSLRSVDRESLALSLSPEFLEIIEKARREFEQGRTLSLDEMKAEVATMKDA